MTANGVYSVLNVPRKATAFPLWRAIESRWNKNMDSLGSSVTAYYYYYYYCAINIWRILCQSFLQSFLHYHSPGGSTATTVTPLLRILREEGPCFIAKQLCAVIIFICVSSKMLL